MLKLDIFRSIFTWIGIINLVIFILLLHYYNFNIIELGYLTYILSLTFIALGKIDIELNRKPSKS